MKGIFTLFFVFCFACAQGETERLETVEQEVYRAGAERVAQYLPLLQGKKVGMVINQASLIHEVHLVDSLMSLNVDVEALFAPEHGIRGKADAGAKIVDGKDEKTGLPIYSLYGKSKKPAAEHLKGVEVMLFDLQDVGVRFYTYISTLHYVMEACAENNIPLVVLDRGNPHMHYIDGPILKEAYKSFIGMHPVPVVYGMSIGEYAYMIKGEKWVDGDVDLTVIPCEGLSRKNEIYPKVAPSPNLKTKAAIALYPSLCFFEGTVFSVGRGTDKPFERFGYTNFNSGDTIIVPRPNEGAKHPKLEGEEVRFMNLERVADSVINTTQINFEYVFLAYGESKLKDEFFLKNNFINLLAGTADLKTFLLAGKGVEEFRASFQSELNTFKTVRSGYLIYE